ncbi:MAG: winged helix-turn-helix domain-containing protein [Myxococcota bacterium]
MGAILQLGARWVDLATGRTSHEEQVRPAELRLLNYLAERLDRTVSLDELHADVWGYHPKVASRSAYSSINRLRALIEPDPSSPLFLRSRRGGYCLCGATITADTTPGRRGSLPDVSTLFVGREELVRRLSSSVPRLRMLVGTGGSGKSRLALEVARRQGLAGGAWWVDAHAARHADDVEERVRELRLLDAPGPRLVIVDDADGVDGLAERLAAWLDAAPSLHVLVTARSATVAPAAEVERIGPLPAADAVRLVRDRARDEVVDALSGPSLDALLVATDRLPLALEIAAANLERLGPDQVLRDLAVLSARADPRGRTLEGVVRWSVEGLRAIERDALAALAAVDGAMSGEAARTVIGGREAANTLGALVEAGLVAVEHRTETRFQVLATVRGVVEADPAALDRLLERVGRDTSAACADPWTLHERPGALRFGLSVEGHAQLLDRASTLGGDRGAAQILGLVVSQEGRSRAALRAVEGALRQPLPATLEFHLRRWWLAAQLGPAPEDYAALLAAAARTDDVRLELLARLVQPVDPTAERPLAEAEELCRWVQPDLAASAQIYLAARRFGAAIRTGATDRARQHAQAALRFALGGVRHPEDASLARRVAMEYAVLTSEVDEAERQATELLALPHSRDRFADAHFALAWVAHHRLDGPGLVQHAVASLVTGREASGHGYLDRLRNLALMMFVAGRPEGPEWLGECLDLESPTPVGEAWRALYRSARAAAAAGPEAGLADAQLAVTLAKEVGGGWGFVATQVGWLAELLTAVGDLEAAVGVLATDGWSAQEVPLHLVRAELLLWIGDTTSSATLAERVAAAPGLAMTGARANAVLAVIAAESGDFATADRHLARAGSATGPGRWWVDLHRELIRAWRESEEPVTPTLEIPATRFAARWATSALATRARRGSARRS